MVGKAPRGHHTHHCDRKDAPRCTFGPPGPGPAPSVHTPASTFYARHATSNPVRRGPAGPALRPGAGPRARAPGPRAPGLGPGPRARPRAPGPQKFALVPRARAPHHRCIPGIDIHARHFATSNPEGWTGPPPRGRAPGQGPRAPGLGPGPWARPRAPGSQQFALVPRVRAPHHRCAPRRRHSMQSTQGILQLRTLRAGPALRPGAVPRAWAPGPRARAWALGPMPVPGHGPRAPKSSPWSPGPGPRSHQHRSVHPGIDNRHFMQGISATSKPEGRTGPPPRGRAPGPGPGAPGPGPWALGPEPRARPRAHNRFTSISLNSGSPPTTQGSPCASGCAEAGSRGSRSYRCNAFASPELQMYEKPRQYHDPKFYESYLHKSY